MRGLNLGKRGQGGESSTVGNWLLVIIVLAVVVGVVIWFFSTPKELIKSVGIKQIDAAVLVCGQEVQTLHSNDATAYCSIFKSFDIGDMITPKISYLSCYEIAKSSSTLPEWSKGLETTCKDETPSARCRQCDSLKNSNQITGKVYIGLDKNFCNGTGLYKSDSSADLTTTICPAK